MPQLKCVGGPRDGYNASIDKGRRDIQLIDPSPRMPVQDFPNSAGLGMMTVSATVYTVRELHGPQGWSLEFLAPHGWTDAKAIEHQFSK